ncbi:regulatory protein RecX [Corynebacterium sp. 335C]
MADDDRREGAAGVRDGAAAAPAADHGVARASRDDVPGDATAAGSAAPPSDRVEALRRAIAEMADADGSGLVDKAAEERRAPIRAHALRLLDQRSRSREELRSRLTEDPEREREDVDRVLDDLEAAHLIDDATFASEWVRQRAGRRGKSRRVLDRELSAKGVAPHLREEALEQVSDADEHATAVALAEKKARTVRAVPADRAGRDKDLRRVVGVLARRGFGQAMAMGIAKEALDARYAELGAGE